LEKKHMATPVLVVDDSAMSRKLIINALPPDWTVEVRQASNGAEAIKAYRAGKAEVIFLDLTMPVMDGFDVLETLRKEDLNTFVIVVSADYQPKSVERALSLGAMAFIQKPVSPDKITSVLRKFGII
jgi:two-component system chemotaxis response regulator CheY